MSAMAALGLSKDREVEYGAALALALLGDILRGHLSHLRTRRGLSVPAGDAFGKISATTKLTANWLMQSQSTTANIWDGWSATLTQSSYFLFARHSTSIVRAARIVCTAHTTELCDRNGRNSRMRCRHGEIAERTCQSSRVP